MTLIEEEELRKKGFVIRNRVAERDILIKEVEIFGYAESALLSLRHYHRLQTEDLAEASLVLVNVMKKQARVTELLAFIEKLESMPY